MKPETSNPCSCTDGACRDKPKNERRGFLGPGRAQGDGRAHRRQRNSAGAPGGTAGRTGGTGATGR